MKSRLFFYIVFLSGILFSCNDFKHVGEINRKNFSTEIDNKPVDLYLLKNNTGMEMAVCNYGAKIVSLFAKDIQGNYDDVVLGYDNLGDYLDTEKRLTGSVVGRVAGRINGGSFVLDGIKYQLFQVNDRNFHSHGGTKGFDKVVWDVVDIASNSITLQYVSEDGEEGYPGKLTTLMTYQLTDNDIFRITYSGKTTKPTIVNLTHHSFFNLAGAGNKSIENHILKLNSTRYLPVLPTTINSGEIAETCSTPLDFTNYKRVGEEIDASFQQNQIARGYDHTWVIDNQTGGLTFAASIYDPESGRKMDVYTDQPCVHFYTARMATPKVGKNMKEYGNRSAFCIETMQYPDAMNQPDFPCYFLYPQDEYRHICEYRFSVLDK